MTDHISKNKTKVVAYARISKLLGGDPKMQIVQIREYAKARGYEVVDEYIDDGISGSAERRPGLDRLMADAKRGKYQVVITAALDRISRSTKHFLTLFDELQNHQISIISLRENLDFTSPTGKMVATVLMSVAALEKATISERIRNSLAARKLAAQQTGSSWRCGRKPVPESKINQVLLLRSQGKSYRVISKLTGLGKSTCERIVKLRVPK